jgi:hypothetical protein
LEAKDRKRLGRDKERVGVKVMEINRENEIGDRHTNRYK